MSNTRNKVNIIHIPDLPFEVDLSCLKDKNKIHGRLIKSRREVNSLQSFFAAKRPGIGRKEKIKHVVYQDRHHESTLYEYHSKWDIYKDKQGLYAIYDKNHFLKPQKRNCRIEMGAGRNSEWKQYTAIKINNADKVVVKIIL